MILRRSPGLQPSPLLQPRAPGLATAQPSSPRRLPEAERRRPPCPRQPCSSFNRFFKSHNEQRQLTPTERLYPALAPSPAPEGRREERKGEGSTAQQTAFSGERSVRAPRGRVLFRHASCLAMVGKVRRPRLHCAAPRPPPRPNPAPPGPGGRSAPAPKVVGLRGERNGVTRGSAAVTPRWLRCG